MGSFLLFIHIVVSLLLIIVVLLQSGKSADLAGAFGGGGSQSTFGPRGTANILSKLTTILAVLFMVTSLSLFIMASNKASTGGSVLKKEDPKQEQKQDIKKEDPQKGKTEAKKQDDTSSKPVKKKETSENN